MAFAFGRFNVIWAMRTLLLPVSISSCVRFSSITWRFRSDNARRVDESLCCWSDGWDVVIHREIFILVDDVPKCSCFPIWQVDVELQDIWRCQVYPQLLAAWAWWFTPVITGGDSRTMNGGRKHRFGWDASSLCSGDIIHLESRISNNFEFFGFS